MKRDEMEVHVILKGDFYSLNTHCSTIKEAIELGGVIERRSQIKSWWKERKHKT